MDDLVVSMRSTHADIVAITEAWRIVPEVCMMQDSILPPSKVREKRRESSGFLPIHPQPITPPGGGCPLRSGGPLDTVTPSSHPQDAAFIILSVAYHLPHSTTTH
ncbi:hypothetical protein E2C01_058602 [Portunus trituberculatus]|uniref:Uncharacterized protein n=1 Tax=Portunus trituberculatus TaxID=210409 RepID=A0A5B7H4D8_PORTR|nr:hypothetical protein [Portunus trituberculatus]